MTRYSSQQPLGPFESGRDIGTGDIKCFFDEVSSPFESGRDIGTGDIDGSFNCVKGALIRLT
jgi:hypothetical protein